VVNLLSCVDMGRKSLTPEKYHGGDENESARGFKDDDQ
jgi:hypothetical protein